MTNSIRRDRHSPEYRLRLLRLVTSVARRFVGPGDLDEAIDAALAEIGSTVGADRAYLFQFRDNGARTSNTHEWCAPGVSPEISNLQDLSSARFPWIIDKLQEGRPFQIEDVSALPTQACAEREVLEAQGIHSCLFMPIRPGRTLTGFVGFDNVRSPGTWEAEDVSLLSLTGQLMGDALERKQAERALRDSETRYRRLVEGLPAIVYRYSTRGGASYWSPQIEQILGFTPQEVTENPYLWHDAIHPEDLPRVDQAIAGFEIGQAIALEYRIRDRRGQWHWFNDRSVGRLDLDGETIIEGVAMDISQHKAMEEALHEERERAQVTLRSIGDAVITTDAQGCVEFLNPVAERLTGWSCAQAQGQPLDRVFRIVHGETGESVAYPVAMVLRGERLAGQADHALLLGRDGGECAVEDCAAPIRDEAGRVLGVVLVFKDVSEQRRLNRQMLHQATHDSLTGLVNRVEFERRLDHAIGSFHSHGTPYALCYLDLDQFKVVNDTAGHAAGDEMLRQIAALLKTRIRSRDTLARLGGDEFSLLLENCPLGNAIEVAEDLVATIGDFRFSWAERRFAIGVSIGVAPVTLDISDRAELMTRADVACFTAKDLGRNRVYVYHLEDSELSRRHREILRAAQLREALEQGLFRLYAQPIRDIVDRPRGRIIHHEILVRLLGEDGEPMLPGSFIPAAERFGVMVELDRWIIREALHQYGALCTAQEVPGIAINLSGSSLGDDRLVAFVRSELAASGVPARQLCFEVTETTAINRLTLAQRLIGELRGLGCRFALDDFGSGLSSFAYLKHLPVDFLKIDGCFVRDMHRDKVDRAMVKAIHEIGHTMGIATVAEWVETDETLAAVRRLGVDFAQGYALGPPRPLAELFGNRSRSAR